jgi:hypothetical protein
MGKGARAVNSHFAAAAARSGPWRQSLTPWRKRGFPQKWDCPARRAAVNSRFIISRHIAANTSNAGKPPMRSLTRLFQASSLAATLLTASAAVAEKRIFIVANEPDGYGIDRCLASGESCGAAAAAAYCRTRDFAQAGAYRRVNRTEITNSVAATDASCRGESCMQFVAIECTR